MSDGESEITEDDALAMLDIHSAAHNARTSGAFFAGVGAGIAVTAWNAQVLGLPLWPHYVVGAAAMLAGIVVSFLGPRAVLTAVDGGGVADE